MKIKACYSCSINGVIVELVENPDSRTRSTFPYACPNCNERLKDYEVSDVEIKVGKPLKKQDFGDVQVLMSLLLVVTPFIFMLMAGIGVISVWYYVLVLVSVVVLGFRARFGKWG